MIIFNLKLLLKFKYSIIVFTFLIISACNRCKECRYTECYNTIEPNDLGTEIYCGNELRELEENPILSGVDCDVLIECD